jgi:hypothetical protein
MPWFKDVASIVPFLDVQHVQLRRVWPGMRGGHFGSVPCGKNYLGHAYFAYDGGAHDSAMFIWTQLLVAGLHPHPGPEVCSTSETATSNGTSLRHDQTQGTLSLYDVLGLLKSSTCARDSLYKTINKPVWLLAIMKRENQFAVQGHTTFTPALISMDELSLLIEFLQSAKSYAGKRKVQLQENMKFLFTTHGSLLKQLWPTGSLPSPVSVQYKTLHYTTLECLQQAGNHLNLVVETTPQQGVFTTSIKPSKADTFVDLIGVYTCTSFSSHKYGKLSVKGNHVTYHRWECCRNFKLRLRKLSPEGSKKKEDVISRPFTKTTKCECQASISGSIPTGSDNTTIQLTLDLRHQNHAPGEAVDARTLPLLEEVQDKMDMVTVVTRNKATIRRLVSQWVRDNFLPNRYPTLQYSTLHPLDGRFFPNSGKIKNSILRAGKLFQHCASDQTSTFAFISSQQSLTWVLRPAQGDSTCYVHIPSTGLQASRIDKMRTVHTQSLSSPTTVSEIQRTALACCKAHILDGRTSQPTASGENCDSHI